MRYSILLVLLLALPGCNEDTPASPSKKSANVARIEQEVTRRVDAAKLESTVRQSRLQTIRLIGLVSLAGGAVGGLVWLRQSRLPPQPPQQSLNQRSAPPLWNDHHPPRPGRVIEFPTVPVRRQKHHPNRRSHPK